MRQASTQVFLVGLLVAAVLVAGCESGTHTTSRSTTTTTTDAASTVLPSSSTTERSLTSTPEVPTPRAILPPATVAPVSDECTLPLTHEEDGNVIPLLCPDGGVNVLAWRQFARGWVLRPPLIWSRTMQLGANATATSVFRAMCFDRDRVQGTNPLTMSAEMLAAAYYGWTFTDSRISNFFAYVADCPAPDPT
jgi:hypothetical protein